MNPPGPAVVPDRTINIAVIGAGAIGRVHVAGLQEHPLARVAAIAESSPERGHEIARQYGVREVVADYRDLLRRDDIDAVSVALPNHLHAPVTLDALRAGKHVLLEKPMAMNAVSATRLVREAKKRGVLLMVGKNMRFTPEVQYARTLVAEGRLGEVYHAKTAWCRRAGIPRIGSWFTQKSFAGGGCTYDIGVHALDRCLYLMGEFDAVAVSGQTFAEFGPRGVGEGGWGKSEIDPRRIFDVEDLAIALIRLRSGRTILLECAWAAHQAMPDYNATHLFGTEAGLSLSPLQLYRPGQSGYATELLVPGAPRVNQNRMAHFVDCLLGRAEPFVSSAEALAVQKILDAIYRSARLRREVRVS